MKFNRILIICAELICLSACVNTMDVESPNGDISVKVEVNGNGIAHYQVHAYGQEILGYSELGLIAKEANLHEGFTTKYVSHANVDEQWEQPWGENKVMRDNHREMAVEMENERIKRLWKNVKRKLRLIGRMILNVRFLLCFGIAWMITNGWSYVMLALGTAWGVPWMIAVSGAYLAFLWLPISPEKVVTVAIALFLVRVLFPKHVQSIRQQLAESQKDPSEQ